MLIGLVSDFQMMNFKQDKKKKDIYIYMTI